jgi:ABC-type phosphate transport system substrate-binding protein
MEYGMRFPLLTATLLACLLGPTLSGFTYAADVVVIVSAKAPIAALQQSQVADIFLGQLAFSPVGDKEIMTAVDQSVGSAVRDAFYRKVTGKTPQLVKAHWAKMIFTGRGQPPREKSDNAAVRKLIAENPHMIGYIDKAELDASVKVVLDVN